MNISRDYYHIVEDNPGNRITLIENEDGKEVYKAIYVNKKQRLKVMKFDCGQIFNDIIQH